MAISKAVEKVLNSYPPAAKKKILRLRKLILGRAERLDEVGEIEETLKWGEPSYLTRNKSGSTIRIAWKEKTPDQYAMYLNCQTTLVDTYRTLFPELVYEGNRAVVFDVKGRLPLPEVTRCIDMALMYHADKKRRV